MVGEETGLSAKIASELMEKFEERGITPDKEKKLKIRKISKSKLKKNYVLVILLKTNGNIDMKYLQIKNDLIYLKDSDTFHSATTDYIGYYKTIPTMILPEWDLKPIARREATEEPEPINRNELMKEAEGGRYANPQTTIIHNIERASGLLKNKPSFGGSKMIWLIIGGSIIAYMVYQAIIGGG